MMNEDEDFPEMIVHLIADSIDLHTFQPREAASIVQEYLRECRQRGFSEVRVIHGKGIGVLREIVHSELRRSPHVASFRPAPPESGGWGATLVVLLPRIRDGLMLAGRQTVKRGLTSPASDLRLSRGDLAIVPSHTFPLTGGFP